MSVTESSQPAAGLRSGHARYVGRVGALALALGIGAAVVSGPVALADTAGSAPSDDGSTTASAPASRTSAPPGARRAGRGATDTAAPTGIAGRGNSRAARGSGAVLPAADNDRALVPAPLDW